MLKLDEKVVAALLRYARQVPFYYIIRLLFIFIGTGLSINNVQFVYLLYIR